ncbi:MAG: hypothetical protein MZU91_01260 [Desulfosudis oleivorans]|nr:hypothetical protein [Desulfosudis oleivorans]
MIVYLHGFNSGGRSRKAGWLRCAAGAGGGVRARLPTAPRPRRGTPELLQVHQPPAAREPARPEADADRQLARRLPARAQYLAGEFGASMALINPSVPSRTRRSRATPAGSATRPPAAKPCSPPGMWRRCATTGSSPARRGCRPWCCSMPATKCSITVSPRRRSAAAARPSSTPAAATASTTSPRRCRKSAACTGPEHGGRRRPRRLCFKDFNNNALPAEVINVRLDRARHTGRPVRARHRSVQPPGRRCATASRTRSRRSTCSSSAATT